MVAAVFAANVPSTKAQNSSLSCNSLSLAGLLLGCRLGRQNVFPLLTLLEGKEAKTI